MARFTKEEMHEEFKEIVYQYARAASFVIEPAAGYRLLFGKDPKNEVDYLHFMNPEVDSRTIEESFSIDHFLATKTVDQFYDYGILGICDTPPDYISGATEWAFAFGLILDTSKSLLISETLNGDSVCAKKCLEAARAFFARLILDGSERVHLEDDLPDNMLTISEVALLADLDERTVRNATNQNATNRLGTALEGSTIYIPREAAIAWLKNKRGFIPTRIGRSISSETILTKVEFITAIQAGEFIRTNRERLNLSQAALAKTAKNSLTTNDITALESGQISINETALIAIGNALGLNGSLFALRLLEVVKKEEIQSLRLRISSAT